MTLFLKSTIAIALALALLSIGGAFHTSLVSPSASSLGASQARVTDPGSPT